MTHTDQAPVMIDRRSGSAELFVPLQKISVPVELTTLRFGDAAIVGNGKDGPVFVGVERKAIRDMLQSLTSGRLSGHQLPGLVEDYTYRWLVLEGSYRESKDGFIEIPRRQDWETIRFKWSALQAYLLTLTMRGGLHVHRTYNLEETASFIATLWMWWTKKEWKDHRSHLALHQAVDYAVFFRPSLAQRVAAQLPGIDERAGAVSRRFPTVLQMSQATEEEWQTIPGIGPKISKRIVQAVQHGKE